MNQKPNLLIQLRRKLIFHKWAIFLALIAGVIIAYPQLYLRYDLGDSYRGIELMGASDDETPRLSRAREAYDGHILLGNPFFKDGKDDPYLVQPLGSIMVAYLGKIFFLDFNNTILLSRLFFTFLIFLALYGFLFSFLSDKLSALVIPSVLFLADSLFARSAIFTLLDGLSTRTNFLGLTRPVNPLITWFFFFGFLLFFWLFLERKQWRWGILSVFMLGLSFYDYFFNYSFLYVFAGVLILIFLFQRKWQGIKNIAIVLLLAVLIAIPYFINLYRATAYPEYAEVGKRLGLIEDSRLVLGFLVPLLFVFFVLFFPRKLKNQYFFGLALVITPFIVLNQQLITSKVLTNVHYHWYMHRPLAIIFLLAIFFYWLSRTRWHFLKKPLAVFLVVFSIFYGIFVQNSSYVHNREKIFEVQRYGPLMDWLNKNAQKDEAVFSDKETMAVTLVYTPLNVFYFPSARYTLAATRERIFDILSTYYRLDGVGAEDAESVFLKAKREISHFLYGMEYRELTGDYSGIPEEIILGHSREYRESLAVPTYEFLKKIWVEYEMDYFVWDTKKEPQWQLDKLPFLEKVAEIGDFAIFQKD